MCIFPQSPAGISHILSIENAFSGSNDLRPQPTIVYLRRELCCSCSTRDGQEGFGSRPCPPGTRPKSPCPVPATRVAARPRPGCLACSRPLSLMAGRGAQGPECRSAGSAASGRALRVLSPPSSRVCCTLARAARRSRLSGVRRVPEARVAQTVPLGRCGQRPLSAHLLRGPRST